MRFDILTLFTDMFTGIINTSILKRARESGNLEVYLHNIRDAASNKHKTVDDTPYGGGAGMILKVDILDAALIKVLADPHIQRIPQKQRLTVLLTPQGTRFKQDIAHNFARDLQQITLICGHYEGYDERIRQLADYELSVGDYVLTGGELPAMIVIDAVTRLIPEVLNHQSPQEESFTLKDTSGNLLLEYPHYTRPLEYKGMRVPEVLLSGNHAEIARWRREEAVKKTKLRKLNETL